MKAAPLSTSGTFLAAWSASPQWVNALQLQARMDQGKAIGFPRKYDLYITWSDNSQWFKVGNFAYQPDSSGIVTIPLASSYLTYGMMVIPTEFEVDRADRYNNSNYYFQLTEMQMGRR
jgi:hypothetical protein